MKKVFRLPSPPMAVALLALFLTLGGIGYAAVQLPPSSVGTVHLKPDAVVSSKVKANAIKGEDVDEATLGPVTKARWTTTDFVDFTGGAETTVASIDLDSGTYVLMGKVHLANDESGSVYVFCELRTSNSDVTDTSGAMIGTGAARVSVPLFLTRTFKSAGRAWITCDPTNPTDAEVGTSSSNRLLAIKVRSARKQ